jgi:hypothetical protein
LIAFNPPKALYMKASLLIFALFCLFSVFLTPKCLAQADTTKTLPQKIYVITTNDGGQFLGPILSQDAKEVLIDTKDRGQVSIPKYQISEIREIKKSDLSAKGDYMPSEVFATRYFITTNGLPIEKRESYILWSLWGPDFEFGVGKNLGVGVMTSWLGVPIIGSVKYSIELAPKVSMALGGLLGTGSWVEPSFGLALPYVALTFGDRKSNISFSGGYGAVFYQGDNNGRGLLSVAGMTKVSKKVSLVFDSFIAPKSSNLNGLSIIIPGIRLQTDRNKTFQFGFAGLYTNTQDSGGQVVPIPFVQFFTKL